MLWTRTRVIVVSPVRCKESVGVDEGIVVGPEKKIVTVIERPAADRFHLRGILGVVVTAVQKNFVSKRFAQHRSGGAASVVILTQLCAVEESVGNITKLLDPRIADRVHPSLLVEAPQILLGTPVDGKVVKVGPPEMIKAHSTP